MSSDQQRVNATWLDEDQMSMASVSYGNAAKVYDLALIARMARTSSQLRMVDLGCGTGEAVRALLHEFPNVEYVGIEPSARAAATARAALSQFGAQILVQPAYAIPPHLAESFDVVLSFSTLEHVYRRDAYLRTAAACLRPDGIMLMNYDHGHFIAATWRDAVKRVIGPVLARLGDETRYQSRVPLDEVLRTCQAAGLVLREQKFFNVASLKALSHLVSHDHRAAFQSAWLAAELQLNEAIPYSDAYAHVLTTVNLVLEKRR